ncbi:MAG: hypothetical protein QMB88_08110, partial [Burkholderiaceae bacterium]
ERPAWPKHFYVVETLPITSVGKIFKPELRCTAATSMVTQLLNVQFQFVDVHVHVSTGGSRGMRVSVSLPQSYSSAAVANTHGSPTSWVDECACVRALL